MFKYWTLKIVLLVILVGLFAMTACHDQLLHPEPKSNLTTANFYNSADDMDSAVLGIYSRLQSRWPTDFTIVEMAADNIYANAGSEYTSGIAEIMQLSITPENNELDTFWEDTYNGIFRINSVLTNIDNPDDYSGNQKDQYIGEARFLRAFFYFDLVRMFGGVPRITTMQTIEEAREVPRATEQEIYDLIIEDLTEAVTLLPDPAEMAHGRASKSAAEALLGKVYVYLNNYNQARTYLENVLNNYNYGLVEDYGSLFNIAMEENSEVIFSLAFSEGTNGHWLSRVFNPHAGLLGYTSRGSEVFHPTWDLHQQLRKDDSRFEETIWEEYIPFNGSPDDEPEWRPFFSKFLVPNLGGAQNSSGLDIPVLRLADVILLYSEVLYELGEVDAALNQLNIVRERAFGDDSHNYSLADITAQEDFIDIMLRERRLEFVLENERWFDIVRMNKLIEMLGGDIESEYNTSTGNAQLLEKNAEPYMRYFPIPREQIDLASPGVLEQNDGY